MDGVQRNVNYSGKAGKWLSEIIELFERQYPSDFDKIAYEILTSNQDNNKIRHRKILQKVLKNTMMYKGKFDVFDKLYSSNPQLRSEAIKYLKTTYEILPQRDKEMLQSAFIDRLKDDNVEVVVEFLDLIKKTDILQGDELRKALIYIGWKCKNNESFTTISEQVLKMLCEYSCSNDWEMFLVIFSYLLPISNDELKFSKSLLSSKLFMENPFLKSCRNKLKTINNANNFINIILKSLHSNNDIRNITEFVTILVNIPDEQQNIFHRYISSLILSNLLPLSTDVDVSCRVLKILLTYYKESALKSKKDYHNISSYIHSALQHRFPIGGFVNCLQNIVDKTLKPTVDLQLTDFSNYNNKQLFFVLLANVIVDPVLSNYDLGTLVGPENVFIQFLVNLSISENENLNENFQEHTFMYLLNNIKKNSDVSEFLELTSNFIPNVLINLFIANENVRVHIMNFIEKLHAIEEKSAKSYKLLLKTILNHKDEILMDNNQIPLILSKLIAPENTKRKKNNPDVITIRNTLINVASNKENPIYLQAYLLKLFKHLNSEEIFEETATTAIDLLTSESLNTFQSTIIACNINKIDADIVKKFQLESSVWKLIIECLKKDLLLLKLDDEQTSVAVYTLNQFDKEFFSQINPEITKFVLDVIIEKSTLTTNPEILPSANRIFKHIDLDAELIVAHLEKMVEVRSAKQLTAKKRISTIPTIDILDTIEWKKGTSVLEFIQDKKKIRNINLLMPLLFKILKKCLDFDEQSAVEYPKQLILSLILHCSQKLSEEEGLKDDIFDVSLIVQCIRASQNPQTHHHALILLSHVAELIPTQVLQYMIPIFTFVGSSVLRHDDAYSFQIMIKIIDTIIPILIQDNQLETIVKVLRDFVDALLDVPEHKRMPLYKQLLEKINVEDHLYLFLLLVFESYMSHASEEKNQARRLNIAADLCREFSPRIVLSTCIKLIKYLKDLPNEKPENGNQTFVTFNSTNYTSKQFRHFKFVLVTFIANLLSSAEFVNQMANLKDDEILSLESLFKEIVIEILIYIQKTVIVAEKSTNTPQSHYWKTILHHCYDILDSTNALLTSDMFLLVVRGLMVHKLATVRRRVLELLNYKLQYNTDFFNDCEKSQIYALITPITSIIETINNEQVETEQEQIVQIALMSLKLLVKLLADKEPEKFIQILEFITNLIRSGCAQNHVLASAILCLAELCVNLRAHAIPSLPEYMPAIIKVLKRHRGQEMTSVFLLSVLTALQKIIDSLPLFLSPYLEKLLIELTLLMSRFDIHAISNTDDPKLAPILNKIQTIKQKVGNLIPDRVLIPAVEACFDQLISKRQFNAISSLMDILSESLASLNSADIQYNMQDLTAFFSNALKFRSEMSPTIDEANLVESHIIKALTSLILKLSESSFRPLYYKLFDWAVRADVRNERLITFYNLSNVFAQSLKGLFVLFAGHFLKNASEVLNECNTIKSEQLYYEDNEKNILLLENVLKTLQAVFTYDNQKFINKERFDVLMQPLVDQLENELNGSFERNNGILIPCLVQFSLAAADDTLWKQMNYQILLKMRHNTPEVRLIALHCLTEIVKKLGEDFLPLLPETIPFLAELLEDEEEKVEKACQKAVQEMEKVLGEPLQKYF